MFFGCVERVPRFHSPVFSILLQKQADYSDKFQDLNISLDFQIRQGSWRRIKRVESKVTQTKRLKSLFLHQASFSPCGPCTDTCILHCCSLGLLHRHPHVFTSDRGNSSVVHTKLTFLARPFCPDSLPPPSAQEQNSLVQSLRRPPCLGARASPG